MSQKLLLRARLCSAGESCQESTAKLCIRRGIVVFCLGFLAFRCTARHDAFALMRVIGKTASLQLKPLPAGTTGKEA